MAHKLLDRAHEPTSAGDGNARTDRDGAQLMAAPFARAARRRIDDVLRDMWKNDDRAKSTLAAAILDGRHRWLERGTMSVPFEAEARRPEAMETYLERRGARGEHRREPDADARGLGRTGTQG